MVRYKHKRGQNMTDIAELEQIMWDGFADVECTEGCGESSRVEPDGDYDCPTEDCTGRLVSPLILEGMI